MKLITALEAIQAQRILDYWQDKLDSCEKRKEIDSAVITLEQYQKQTEIYQSEKKKKYSAKRYCELWENAEIKIEHLEKLIEYLEKQSPTVKLLIQGFYNDQT